MSNPETVLDRRLIQTVIARFALRLRDIHGLPHWVRVRHNGLLLAEETGARRDVVELFALFHDARRLSDGQDPQHGARGAELARELHGELYQLDEEGLELLTLACRDHSLGLTEADVTVQTCWDADRLDLYRVGIHPTPGRLCTETARQPEWIEAAVARSRGPYPALATEWAGYALAR